MVELPTEAEPVRVVQGDCLEVLRELPDGCVDSVVTDPPYELGFMGRAWDKSGVAFDPATWAAVLNVLKPGGYMLAMGGTRTYHRLTCAIEDAGFEVRDCLMWMYGTGFPKGKGCLKPAWEPILLARKPGPRVLPLGVDECRVGTETIRTSGAKPGRNSFGGEPDATGSHIWNGREPSNHSGRYPANVVHDGSDEVMEAFAAFGESKSPNGVQRPGVAVLGVMNDDGWKPRERTFEGHGDSGTAARFFYCAKASKADRGAGNMHPTVKPLALMRWLVRLVCPEAGTVLDPFGGSGSTGVAASKEGRRALLIEKEPSYVDIARRRVAEAMGGQLLTVGAP